MGPLFLMSADVDARFQRHDGYTDHRPRSTSQAGAIRRSNQEGDRVQPSFPIKVFRKEKVPKRKHPDEQFRSTAIPDNAEWQPSAEKVLPSSRADWRVATMIRSEPSYRKRFIYANAQKETDVTFAQCPLPCSSGELSGICESIVDWLHEMSFLKGWEPIQLSQKEDVWLKWGADDFRTIN